MNCKPIARIYNDFPTKFGLPRQSGMAEHLISKIIMEKEYQAPEAFRGIEEFEFLWLLWEFEPMGKRTWSPTVRPPKLGGNKRMGVFATRSPNRPNPIGLTRVRLLGVEQTESDGTVLTVSGADLMSGTAILDIKPYLPFADSAPKAAAGDYGPDRQTKVLEYDPRPGYQNDPERIYGFAYGGYDIKFRIADDAVTVTEAVPLEASE